MILLYLLFIGICNMSISDISACSATKAKNSRLSHLIPREVLFGNPQTVAPKISPNGLQLTYIAPLDGVLNIWIKTIGQQDDTPLTHDTHRGIRSYFWGYDNTCVFYLKDHNGNENQNLFKIDLETKTITNVTPFATAKVQIIAYEPTIPNQILLGINNTTPEWHDAYSFDTTTNALTRIEKNPGYIKNWIADSNLCIRGALQENESGDNIVFVRKNSDDPWKELITWEYDDAANSQPLGFSKNGKYMYLIDAQGSDTAQLVRINLKTKKKTVIAHDAVYDISSIFTHPKTKELISVSCMKARIERTILDSSFKKDFDALSALNPGDWSIINYDSSFTRWIVLFINDTAPVSYYLYDRTTKKAEFLFYDQPALNNYQLAPMEPFSYTAHDGLTLHGYITHPTYTTSHTDKPPLVLLVHGGPWTRDTWGYDREAQWLANRGITCLQINYRGSTGYGKNFINAADKQWARDMHTDLLDGIAWAVKEGFADVHNIGIYGGSYGGYAALVGATFTPDVFRCAIDMVGPSNLLTLISSIPPYWKPELASIKKRIGDPDTESEMLKERSPLFKVDNIKIPLLIAQGANDPRVKQAESDQIVAAMQAKNIPHEYLLFKDEGHGLARPENKAIFYAAAEKFLTEHLDGCRYEK